MTPRSLYAHTRHSSSESLASPQQENFESVPLAPNPHGNGLGITVGDGMAPLEYPRPSFAVLDTSSYDMGDRNASRTSLSSARSGQSPTHLSPDSAAGSIRSFRSSNGKLRKSQPAVQSSPQRPPMRPISHSTLGSIDWIKTPVCEHCGSLTPRSGATTVYGTPMKSRSSSFLASPLQSSQLQSALAKVHSSDTINSICLVEKVNDKDDVLRIPPWKERLHIFAPAVSLFAVISYWVYFAYRIHCIQTAQVAANKTFAMAWTFIAVEMGVACPMLLHRFWQIVFTKARNREKLRVVGKVTPTVDVFLTCCGEEREIIMDTARAAANQDWPQDAFRVIILDDKGDKELKAQIEELNLQFPNVFYASREKIPGVPHHFKAGNLNYGLDYVTKLDYGYEGAGEYMAALDADMIPEPDWLRAVISHLVLDPGLAMSCPPQLFYNVPKNDPLLQSLNSFVHISEVVKDAAGVAWCTGSGYAMRRTAMDSIGGFPIGSLAEDVCTSSMLLGAGWKTAYVHEPLQFGTVPDSFVGHLKQRTRWTIGTVQTSAKLNFCLFGPLIKHMGPLQRISGFVYTISSLFTIFLTISIFTVPIVLSSGGTLVAYADENQLRWLIRLCFIALFTSRIGEWLNYMPAGYRLGQRENGAMMWMAPFHAIAIIRAFFLPKWLGGKVAAFASSGSISCELNERDAKLRAPLKQRLRVILWDCRAGMHVVYILFVVAAVTLSTARCWTASTDHTVSSVMVYMLTHAAWPPVLWWICLVSCATPLSYALWPPTMPDREELLDRDPNTGVAYPKQSSKEQTWGASSIMNEVQYSLLTIYTTILFVGTFFY